MSLLIILSIQCCHIFTISKMVMLCCHIVKWKIHILYYAFRLSRTKVFLRVLFPTVHHDLHDREDQDSWVGEACGSLALLSPRLLCWSFLGKAPGHA